jgi:hypothetical protein
MARKAPTDLASAGEMRTPIYLGRDRRWRTVWSADTSVDRELRQRVHPACRPSMRVSQVGGDAHRT